MNESPDKNVEAVRQQLLERSRVGLKKYGVTTEREDLTFLDWCNHAQQENMDSAVYIEKLKGWADKENQLCHLCRELIATIRVNVACKTIACKFPEEFDRVIQSFEDRLFNSSVYYGKQKPRNSWH